MTEISVTIQTTFGSREVIAEPIAVKAKGGQSIDVALFYDEGEWNFTDALSGGAMFKTPEPLKDVAIGDFRKKMRRVTIAKVREQREIIAKQVVAIRIEDE